MFIYYDSHGVLKELVNDEAIRQGNHDTNKLYFFIEGAEPQVDSNGVYLARYYASGNRVFIDVTGNELTSQSFSVTPVTMEIPFNKKRELKHFKYWTKYQMFVINVPDDILNNSGTVGCRIQMINNGEIDTQGFVVFNVEYTGNKAVISPDTAINISQWNYLIANMITKENIGALSGSLVLFHDYDTSTKTLASAVNEIGLNTPFVMSINDELSLCVIVEGDNNGYIVYANNSYGLYESEEAAGTTVLNNLVWYPHVVSDNFITLTNSSGTLNAVQIEYIRKGNCYIKYGNDYYRKVSDDGTTAVFKTYTWSYSSNLISVWDAYVNVTLSSGAYVASGQLYQVYDSSVVELKANKVTTISNTSTDTQYPSAKCVYDNLVDLREVAEGKCRTLTIAYSDTLADLKTAIGIGVVVYDKDGNDISQDITDGDYDSVAIANSDFNTQNDSFGINPSSYLIIRSYQAGGLYNFVCFAKYKDLLRIGDIVLVVETQVPDRWYGGNDTFYKMETAKIDISNMVTTDTDQTITGTKTINDTLIISNGTAKLTIKNNGWTSTIAQEGGMGLNLTGAALLPTNNSIRDLGSSSYYWKDLYLSGVAYLGSGTQLTQASDSSLQITLSGDGKSLRPSWSGHYDIGTNGYKWNNIWANTLKGVTTLTQAQYDALVSGGTVDADTLYFIEEE